MAAVGDYIIIPTSAKKKALARITRWDKDERRYQAILEEDVIAGETAPFDFAPKEILATLGRSPNPGSVYGVRVEPLRERIDHPFWGEIRLFVELEPSSRKSLITAMKDVKATLAKRNLPELPINTELRQPRGKMRGYYKYTGSDKPDTLALLADNDSMVDLDYVISHEYAHGIWYRHLLPKQRMSWIRLYHDAVSLGVVKNSELQSILEDLVSVGDLRGYYRDCDEHTLTILRAILRHVKQVHSIDRKHLDLAIAVGDDISRYWPRTLELGEKNLVLTDYARKSPEELFSEAFSLSFIGKKLPKQIAELLDKHLRSLKK